MKRELHTPRLRLRPPQPGDEHAVFTAWSQDIEVLRYLGWVPHTTLAQTQAQLNWDQARWLKRSAWTWLLLPREVPRDVPGASPIGMVQLVPQQLDGPPHHLRLGYLLARHAWGQGWMREALTAVLDETDTHETICRIDALCDVANPASIRLLQTLGFVQEGVLRRHTRHPNVSDSPRDVAVLAHIRG